MVPQKNCKEYTKKCPVLFYFNFSGLLRAIVLSDTFMVSILKELSKTVFKSFIRQFSSEICLWKGLDM